MEAIFNHELVMCDLEHQKIIEQKECFIKLFNDHFEYKVRFLAEEPIDKDEITKGTKEVATYYHRVITKASVTAIDMDNVVNEKADAKWMVTLNISGSNVEVKIYFVKSKDALNLYKELVKWRFNYNIE